MSLKHRSHHVVVVVVVVVGAVVSPVVLVPGDELLQTALHDAGDPVSLTDITHEFDRNSGRPGEHGDQHYQS